MPLGSRDFNNYLRDFDEINSASLFDVIRLDPLYSSVVWVSGHLGMSSHVFYLSFASLALAVKLAAIAKLADKEALSIALYMCSFFFLHEFTQIRASLAIGLWMLGLSVLPQSRSRYFMWTLLGSFVHIQAVLGLLLYPIAVLLNSRWRARIFALAVVIVIVISTFGIFDLLASNVINSFPDPRAAIYVALAMESPVRPNPLSVMSLLAIFTALVGLLPGNRGGVVMPFHLQIENFVFYSLILGSLSIALFASIPIAAFRISEHLFSLLPVGLLLAAKHVGASRCIRPALWVFIGLFLYIFLFHSPYLLDPFTGQHPRDNE
jgi:hypothetical protein